MFEGNKTKRTSFILTLLKEAADMEIDVHFLIMFAEIAEIINQISYYYFKNILRNTFCF